jgi:type IV fimbrial biogenesis protein FimT
MDKRTQTGFTLYELLITVLIVGVILTFALPNLQDFARNSRMTATANNLHSAFHLARSESSRAKTNITVCASSNPLQKSANCGGTWDQGYIVFVDEEPDRNRSGETETVLRAQGAIADSVSMAVANDATYFTFSSTGLGRAVPGNTPVSRIVMCDDRGNITASGGSSAARLFMVTPLGRATIFREKDLIEQALNSPDMGGKTCP